MHSIATRPDGRPSWKRLLLGAFASFLLWAPWPALASLFDGNLAQTTSDPRESALRGLITIAFIFAAAVLMNYWFAVRVLKAKGRSFWLLPFLTLPVATALMSVSVVTTSMFIDIGVPTLFQLIMWLGYTLFVALVIVMGTMLWLTYPLAILNQWLLRKIYNSPAAAAEVPVP